MYLYILINSKHFNGKIHNVAARADDDDGDQPKQNDHQKKLTALFEKQQVGFI